MGVDFQFSLFRLTFTPAPSSHSQQPSPLVPLVPEDPLVISLEKRLARLLHCGGRYAVMSSAGQAGCLHLVGPSMVPLLIAEPC